MIKKEEIIVSIDAMGGDNAPFSTVNACRYISSKDNLRLLFVGDEEVINKHLKGNKYPFVDICNINKCIKMDDKVNLHLLRSKDNSMCHSVLMLKSGKSNYALSAGNTAAFVSYAISELGLISNIDRPAIAILLPNVHGTFTVFADVGANINTKPVHILQTAIMSSLFASKVFDINNPKVALLNIGSESTKGDELRKSAFGLLQNRKDLNFMGNLEGQDLFSGKVDIVIADGFTGNVILKATEGLTRSFKTMLMKEVRKSMVGKISGLLLKDTLKNFAKKTDYAEYGGGILLGVNGVVVISHGRSSSRAIYNAIKFGKRVVESELLKDFKNINEKR